MKNFLFTIIFLSLNIFATEDSIPVCPENGSHIKCINNFGVGYYIGAVINGKNHGYGVYENGKEKFEGEWFEGLRREGTQTFKDGSIYSGEWGIKYPSTMGITGKGCLSTNSPESPSALPSFLTSSLNNSLSGSMMGKFK